MAGKSVLFEGESLLFSTRKHWLVIVKALLLLLVAYLAWSSKPALLKLAAIPNLPEDFARIVPKAISVVIDILRYGAAAIFGVWGLHALVSLAGTRVLVTDKRLVRMDSLFGTLYSADLDKIESVEANLGLIGQFVGFGRVTMIMVSGAKLSISDLVQPHILERVIFQAK